MHTRICFGVQWVNRTDDILITSINDDVCLFESDDTVELRVTSDDRSQTFYVQLSEGKHSTDLGCWLLTDDAEDAYEYLETLS